MEDGTQLPTFFDDLEDETETGFKSISQFTVKAPSLIDLCTDEFKNQILLDEFSAEELSELPPHLFEALVMNLPAAALENLDKSGRVSEEQGDSDESSGEMKRFRRSGIFYEAWRKLYEMRFMMHDKSSRETTSEWKSSDDWRQAYWQRHLQGCLDFATEQTFQPSYKGDLSQMHVSSYIWELVGYKEMSSPLVDESMMMSYHFQRFAKYARCLKIRNVICTPEICDILKNCELKSLILRRIRTTEEVDVLCDLLKQNMRTLKSLHFIDAMFSSTDVVRICYSLCSKELGMHLLQDLVFIFSRLSDSNGCEPFLLKGRYLRSVSVSQNVICQEFAESFFSTLVNTSSSIEALDLSENSISGWFSELKNISPLNSLSSLHKLVLRGNNMRAKEIDDLKFALRFLPNLNALDLSDNPIGYDAIGNLISCILDMAERNTFLKHLKLKNCGFWCTEAVHILEALSSLKTQLLSLSIADNHIGSDIAVPLGRFLRTRIRDLDIELIGLGALGFKKLGQEIGKDLQLETINISRNRGKSTTAKIISKLISGAPRLKIIHAAQNLMPPESMLKVCSTLKNNIACAGNLELVDLSLNTYSPSLDAVRKEFTLDGMAKPLVVLPDFETVKFIHDDDP